MMRVISNRRLVDFATSHPQADVPLRAWRKILEAQSFASFAELKVAFGSVDKAGPFYVFDIGGNKFRVVAAIHFNRRCYISATCSRTGSMTMGALMLPPDEAADLARHFNAVKAKVPLRVIDSEADYDAAVAAMDALIDSGAADENHPLADLLSLLGTFVGGYDARHYAPANTTPASVLAFAMDRHGLSPRDLPEIGDEIAVSAVLDGQRDLTLSETRRVAERLGLSPVAFL